MVGLRKVLLSFFGYGERNWVSYFLAILAILRRHNDLGGVFCLF